MDDELKPEYELNSLCVRSLGLQRTDFGGFIQSEVTQVIDKEHACFWITDWQQAEREAQADLDEGRSQRFDSVEDLIADLDSED